MDFGGLSRAAEQMSLGDRGGGRGGGRGRGDRGRGGRGRGARGRPERTTNYDVVSTRPRDGEGFCSKAGTSGQPIGLITNYIGFKKKPDSTLFKYRVDFRSK